MRHAAIVRCLLIVLVVAVYGGWPAAAPSAHAAAVVADGTGGSCRRAQPAAYAAQAAVVHRASLVVTFGNATPTMRFCIEFTEASISGLDLLQRSGLPVVTSGGGLGAAVCAIDGVGSTDASSYSTCLGHGSFWAYYQYAGGAWSLSPAGASTTVVSDGAVEGWAYGNNAKPDAPGTICPAATATSTFTPPASATVQAPTARPTATSTPAPSSPTAVATSTVPAPATAVLPASPGATARPAPPAPGPPMSEVHGAQATPGVSSATPAPSRTPGPHAPVSATASATAASGIIIGAAEGKVNAARAEAGGAASWSSGGRSLIAFVAVAAALAALAGYLFRRRRQRDG
ncbi:MAG: LPXTG cell wall anchor domain-containing protein [Chloroflexota bacterium]|nr:LPXTG cell wall anchor domain-containing protein [Chloroflexota bacterium]